MVTFQCLVFSGVCFSVPLGLSHCLSRHERNSRGLGPAPLHLSHHNLDPALHCGNCLVRPPPAVPAPVSQKTLQRAPPLHINPGEE
ncbi:hypothetical protein JZ751_006559 [Albula glossodonta]|uniref:Secreted protein n=1 Tax=Albula glossodonta TaxID=121402 RepID=A0A8T2MU92_9TELE|nr:hypothetical protein JZ751_006559 [Albula glossodonta]